MKRLVVKICLIQVCLLLAVPLFGWAAAMGNGALQQQAPPAWQRLHEMNGDIVGIAVADLDHDGQQELALLFPEYLEVGRIQQGAYSRIDSLQLPAFSRALGIDSADLDGDGRFELYLSLVTDFEATSMRVEYRDQGLKVTQGSIRYLLRSIQLPGGKVLLLGQQLFGGKQVDPVYNATIWRMALLDGKVRSSERLDYPRGVNILSLQPFAGGEGQLLFADISATRRLRVHDRQHQLWKSAAIFGGTPISFDVEDIPSAGTYTTVPVLIEQRLETGPAGVLLVPRNGGRSFNTRYTNFGPSQLVAMRWQGDRLQEIWHTKEQDGGMIDFRWADVDNDGEKELVMAIVDAPPKATSRGKASLLTYEIQ